MSIGSPDRLHGLDAVRGGALLLGIVFHAGFSFFPGDQFWLIADAQRSASVSGLSYVLHIFRMTIFFLLAGYFGRMQTYRLGTPTFIRDRLKRVGAPLVIFWPIMMVCFTILAIWGFLVANGGVVPENPPEPPAMSLKTLPLAHLWFLYVLLLLYAVMLAGRALLSVLRVKTPLGRLSDWVLRKVSLIGLLPIIMAAPVAIAFLYHQNWHPFFGIPTPEYGFVPNRVSTIAYGGAFGLGWLLQREPGHLHRAVRAWPVFLVGAIGLSGYCLTMVGTTVTYYQPLPEHAVTLYPWAYALAIWFWTFGLIGLALKVWSGESTVRRYIADASYWLYLIHLPIIMALQILVSQWAWPAELKYATILGLSIPLMLLSYEFLVRYTFIGGLLNGRKRIRSPRN
jgi:glucan biosynthesis protein C